MQILFSASTGTRFILIVIHSGHNDAVQNSLISRGAKNLT